jgi:hypothetical protein
MDFSTLEIEFIEEPFCAARGWPPGYFAAAVITLISSVPLKAFKLPVAVILAAPSNPFIFCLNFKIYHKDPPSPKLRGSMLHFWLAPFMYASSRLKATMMTMIMMMDNALNDGHHSIYSMI